MAGGLPSSSTFLFTPLLLPRRDGGGRSAAPFQGSTLLKTLKGHKAPLRGVVVLPDAGHVASASCDGRLLLWDYSAGTILRRFRHAEELTCLACRYDVSL